MLQACQTSTGRSNKQPPPSQPSVVIRLLINSPVIDKIVTVAIFLNLSLAGDILVGGVSAMLNRICGFKKFLR